MINKIRSHYIQKRLAQVDHDFLSFEEDMCRPQDLQRITDLLSTNSRVKIKNPHNSILLYITGITDEFDFDRARADTVGGTPPDIDIDFHDRTTAVEWTINYWGRDQVAKILTHGTYGVLGGSEKFFKATAPAPIWNKEHTWKLNQKQLDTHWGLHDRIEAGIPDPEFGKAPDMEKVFKTTPELETDEELDAWRQYMSYVEGKIFNYGVHASGVVVSDFPLYKVMPLMVEQVEHEQEDGTTSIDINRITQMTMSECDWLGTIKFDFLGIDNLSIINNCIAMIHDRTGKLIDIYKIEDHDKLTYDLLGQGLLTGVFQFETSGSAKRLILQCKPSSVEELSDLSSLNRPGPLAKGPNGEPSIADRYVENKNNGYAPADMPEALQQLLKTTYWSMVYQEQVMQICSEMAGFTLREADDIRRAMGKKKKEVLEPYEVKFLDGAAAVGKINKSLAKEIWQEMVNFADYAFNKSHSICYSYLSYVCAWLKANYPVEFFCSLMTIRSLNNTKWEKAPEFIFEARQRGLKIHGPNINRSHAEFVPEQDDIYWGFQAIKGIGKSTGEAIVRARGATKFKDIWDFLDRVDRSKINSGNFKALAAAGAFDCLGYDRDELVAQAETLYEHLRLEEKYQERLAAKAEAEQQNARRAVRKEELDSQAAQAKARKKAKLELTSEDQAILDRPDRMARLRELARQCKLTGSTLQSVMTVEELLEYEEQQWLRNQAVPKIPDVPPRWSPTRTKQLAISVPALQNQRKYCGAYVGIHPAQVMFPNSVSFKDAEHKDFGTYAGEINGVKEITTKRGQKMAFATLEDSSSRAEVIIFPTTWSKLQKEGLANRLEGSLCLVRGEIEIEGDPLENPVIKIKANSFKLS